MVKRKAESYISDLNVPILSLYSSQNELLAYSAAPDNCVYIYSWDKLDIRPQKQILPDVSKTIPLGNNCFLSMPSLYSPDMNFPLHKKQQAFIESHTIFKNHITENSYNTILMWHATAPEKVEAIHTFDSNYFCDMFMPLRKGIGALLLLREEIAKTNNFDNFTFIVSLWTKENGFMKIATLQANEDGEGKNYHSPMPATCVTDLRAKTIAIIGANGNGGWIACIDVDRKRVLWENRYLPGTLAFNGGAISADGKLIYAGSSNGDLYVQDQNSGDTVKIIKLGNRIERIDASDDGKWIGVGLADTAGTVLLINASTYEIVCEFKTDDGNICGLLFSPDCTKLAAAGVSGKGVNVFKIPEFAK